MSYKKPHFNITKNLEEIAEIFLPLLENLELAWWLEIVTTQPYCTYYFGSFVCVRSAQAAQDGYIEDLEQEGAQVFSVKLKQFQPKELTIYKEEVKASVELVSEVLQLDK